MIELNYNGNTIKIHNDDASYAYSALKSKPQLVLKFSLSEYIDFPVGTYCDFQGVRYVLKYADNLKKNGERDIEYTMTMGTDVDDLADYKMRNSVDGRLKFSMCATPKEFIEEIVAELNSKGTGSTWSVGECIESTEKTVEFNHTYIYDALASIAEKFDTEWEIVDHAISLRKVEYFKGSPLELSYGKGCGFIPSVGRTIASDSRPIKRLYVQGGSDNIDKSKYGSSELHLPKSQSYTYKGHTYTSDKDGSYIERSDKTVQATKEDSLDCSEIYPSRVGTVTSVETVNKDKNFYDIIDNTIPDKLNFNDCIIEGETPTIIFQSGMLAGDGKEFEFKYTHTVTKDGKTTAERRFEIVPQEIDGVVMPNETFKPKEGDKYAVFGIMLPDAYICDNDTKTGASWDMMKEAAQYLFEHEEQKFTFTGTLQGLWAKKRWDDIGGRFKIGSYISFKDKQFLPNGVNVRIIGIKQYINTPYSPTIEISNSTVGESIASDLNKIDNTQVTINDTKNDILSFTKRRFRDAEETAKMLQDALLNYSSSIDPITVHTMQLLVGDESLQFDYIASTSQPENVVACNFKWNEKEKTISCEKTAIIHYTVGINDLSSSHTSNERKKWNVMGLASGALNDASKKYYIYIKCPYSSFDSNNVSTETAEFVLSETAKSMDDTDNSCYYFLAGILNSEYDGTRSFVAMNGFTEITPGQILADRLISKSGTSYFDLLNNAMRLGDRLKFNVNGDGKLVLKGTIVQSQGGEDEEVLGCFRGVWNASYVYYVGDEVVYTANNITSYYRCIQQTTAGIAPTNTAYWQVLSAGLRGMDGDGFEYIFKTRTSIWNNPTAPATSQTDDYVPTGWTDDPSGVDSTNQYEYVSMRKKHLGVWGNFSTPSLWAKWSNDGDNGNYIILRYRWAVDKPAQPSGSDPYPANWYDNADREDPTMQYEGSWYGRNGFYYSPKISHEEVTWQKVKFTTTKPNQVVAVDLHVSSEINFDFARVGQLDNAGIINLHPVNDKAALDAQTIAKISGYTSTIVYVEVATEGEHFFYVGYTKDTSSDVGSDQAWFRILKTENMRCWLCQALVDGETGYVDTWGEVIQFIYDNSSEESIYLLSESSTAPSTPTSEPLIEDYVPYLTSEFYSETKSYAVGNKVMHSPYTGYVYAFECIAACTGVAPTNTSYWKQIQTWTDVPQSVTSTYRYQFVSIRRKTNGRWGSFSTPQLYTSYIKGDKGDTGDYFEYRYAVNGSTTTAPALSTTVRNPSGWSTVVPSVGSLQYLWMSVAKINGQTEELLQNWSTPKRVTPVDGTKGDSPALVFRGNYDSSKTYYGNKYRVDAVKYTDNKYYVARTDAGNFSNVVPTNTDKWNSFGASFESIATGLLLAENANIAGWIFRDNKLYSQNGSTYLDGVNGNVDIKGKFLGQINATSGSFKGTSGKFEILLDADNRIISIKGPRKVTTIDGFTEKSGTSQVEYLNIGKFINVGGSDTNGYDIVPQIEIKRLTDVGTVTITIDPYNGMVFENIINGKTYTSIFDGNSWYIGNLDALPSSRSATIKGGVYRDGETLKVRTT